MSGFLDQNPLYGNVPPWPPSSYISPPGLAGTSAVVTNTNLRLQPTIVPNAIRLIALAIETTVASIDAGAIARLGVWAVNSSGFPLKLMTPASGTTVAIDGATGFLETSAMSVVLPPGLYYAGTQEDLAPANQATFRINANSALELPGSIASISNAGYNIPSFASGPFTDLTGIQLALTANVPRVTFRTGVL